MKLNKIRFVLFLTFALLLPCSYLIVRYNLFTKTNRTNIGIWGIIVLGIFVSVVSVLINYYLQSMKTKYAYGKQLLNGLVKLILPLILLLVITILLKDNSDKLIEALIVIIPCEIVAIFVNPFPKWCFENNVEGISEILDKIKKKGESE